MTWLFLGGGDMAPQPNREHTNIQGLQVQNEQTLSNIQSEPSVCFPLTPWLTKAKTTKLWRLPVERWSWYVSVTLVLVVNIRREEKKRHDASQNEPRNRRAQQR